MIEDDADEQEQAEAEALARALESADASSTPDDALETASLLRAVAQPGELSQARADAVLAALGPAVARYVKPQRARVAVWIAAGGMAAAAAAALYLSVPRASEPRQHDAVAASDLPVPAPALLAAQSALSSSDAQRDLVLSRRATFEREMRAYRERMLSKLKRSYPTMVGMLEPRQAR